MADPRLLLLDTIAAMVKRWADEPHSRSWPHAGQVLRDIETVLNTFPQGQRTQLPWRTGSKNPRVLYDAGDNMVGAMDDQLLALLVVSAVNAYAREGQALADALQEEMTCPSGRDHLLRKVERDGKSYCACGWEL